MALLKPRICKHKWKRPVRYKSVISDEGMAIQQSMSTLLLLLLVASGACLVDGGTSAVINSTCSAGANGYVSLYDYCVRTLSADPAAATSPDATRLAIAAANLTSANVTLTLRFIQGLVGTLEECVTRYKDMNRSAADAFDDLRAGRIDAALPQAPVRRGPASLVYDGLDAG